MRLHHPSLCVRLAGGATPLDSNQRPASIPALVLLSGYRLGSYLQTTIPAHHTTCPVLVPERNKALAWSELEWLKKCRLCLATCVAYYNSRTRLVLLADTCFQKGYPLTPSTLEGSAGCSASGDFPCHFSA